MTLQRSPGSGTTVLLHDVPGNRQVRWWKDPGLRKLDFLLLSTFLGSMANGYNISLIAGLEAIPRWFRDFEDLSDKNTLGRLIAANAFGGLLSFFAAPWIADKLGRRWGIILSNLGIMATALGQCFCRTANQFFGTRLVLGFFALFNSISAPALLAELAHPRQRAILGALYSPAAFLLFVTLQLCFVILTPESPRWLVRNNRMDEARRILVRYHANGDESDELVALELAAICASLELAHTRKIKWTTLFATPGNRKRVLILGITGATQQQGINGGLQLFNLILSVPAALLANRAGRRTLLLASVCLMLLFMTLVLVCSAIFANTGSQTSGNAVIAFLFLFLGSYTIGFVPIPALYINEIWPTELRTKGTSVFWFSSTLAICFNQWVNPIALASLQWRYYSVYVGVLVCSTLFIFLMVPETKGRSLEEASVLFDARLMDLESASAEKKVRASVAQEITGDYVPKVIG
ncbi:MFS general substrate transporter [Thozetella sp. PMI_491]|nr:MFS general substrate transporter [Thozetella sp. PMI_491]